MSTSSMAKLPTEMAETGRRRLLLGCAVLALTAINAHAQHSTGAPGRDARIQQSRRNRPWRYRNAEGRREGGLDADSGAHRADDIALG